MKKRWLFFSLISIVLTVLAFYYVYLNLTFSQQESLNRAQIARMLALTFYNAEECSKHARGLDEVPEDLNMSQWYGKYVAVALKEEWMFLNEDGQFEPDKPFVYADLKQIMDHFYIMEDSLSFKIQYREDDGIVLKKHWTEVYDRILVDQNRVTEKHYRIKNTASNKSELSYWQVETNEGIKIAEGLWIDPYINMCVEVYEVDGQILYISKIIDDIEDKTKNEEGEEKIKVILNEKDMDYEHEYVMLTSDQTYYVVSDQAVWKYGPKYPIEFHFTDQLFNKGDVTIKTDNDQGKIKILSLNRDCGEPEYEGEIHILKGKDGLQLVNEVDMESYVAGVVASEMPSSYGIEALKAQAVCARTYGEKSLTRTFQSYPANVDDTTATQVYNNILATEESRCAAKETKNQVLKDEEGLVDTYFFSTSCGHTSAPKDVWYDGKNKDDEEAITVFLSDNTVRLDLSLEEDFRSFINLENNTDYFEKDLPWFRWQVFITDESIEDQVSKITGNEIGDLVNLRVTERAKSGVIKAIEIKGNCGSCTVYGEYRIRQIFSPVNSEIIQKDGNRVNGMALLPSGYFYMDPFIENQGCEGYLIHGGGYGHGCGMSQNGAMVMAEQGMDFKDILDYFYSNIEIVSN